MHATKGNGKLAKRIGVFDLLVMPPIICRGAAWCFGRCFAIKQQNTHQGVLLARLDNLEETLRPDFVDRMVQWILMSGVEVMTFNHSGDWWGRKYVDDCAEIARRLPHIRFFGYTKSLDLDLSPLLSLGNWVLIKSFGGKWNDRIDKTTDNYSGVIHDISEMAPGEWLCPDKGGKKSESKKVCGKAGIGGCTYCMEGGHQVRVCFIEKVAGFNGHRLFLKPSKMTKEIADRIRAATRKIVELNAESSPP
jgi:hypothetical protein